ncbi:unnamed protein product [Cuscuta campestris]|uniref:Alcohol dehydrogenase-like C-terminal domain-containing protein n=1 Tax=Cuscuta campestris TaxID=132261 RepID=A0A484MIH6_9ASTE|nr:unnamed protein product [Cuscuta campestris]
MGYDGKAEESNRRRSTEATTGSILGTSNQRAPTTSGQIRASTPANSSLANQQRDSSQSNGEFRQRRRSSSNDDRSGRAWAVTGLLGQRYPTVRDAVYPPFGSSSLSYHLGDHSHTMKESLCSSRSPSSKVFCQVHQSLRVTVISTSADKKQEAIERFGVDSFLISCDPE